MKSERSRHARYRLRVRDFEIGLFLFLVLSIPMWGQESAGLKVSVDRPSRVILPGGYTTFVVDAENTSEVPIELQVIRTRNDYPDEEWTISICSPTICYDKTVDTLETYTLMPGQVGGAQVHITAGDTGTAYVQLSFDISDGSEPQLIDLSAEVGQPPEPSLFVRVDSTESTARPGDTVEFGIFILNSTEKTLNAEFRRLEEDYPEGSAEEWSSMLCYFGKCEDPDTTSITTEMESEEGVVFSIKIIAGSVQGSGSIGEVELIVDPRDGTEPLYYRFGVVVGEETSSVRSSKDAPLYELDLSDETSSSKERLHHKSYH